MSAVINQKIKKLSTRYDNVVRMLEVKTATMEAKSAAMEDIDITQNETYRYYVKEMEQAREAYEKKVAYYEGMIDTLKQRLCGAPKKSQKVLDLEAERDYLDREIKKLNTTYAETYAIEQASKQKRAQQDAKDRLRQEQQAQREREADERQRIAQAKAAERQREEERAAEREKESRERVAKELAAKEQKNEVVATPSKKIITPPKGVFEKPKELTLKQKIDAAKTIDDINALEDAVLEGDDDLFEYWEQAIYRLGKTLDSRYEDESATKSMTTEEVEEQQAPKKTFVVKRVAEKSAALEALLAITDRSEMTIEKTAHLVDQLSPEEVRLWSQHQATLLSRPAQQHSQFPPLISSAKSIPGKRVGYRMN